MTVMALKHLSIPERKAVIYYLRQSVYNDKPNRMQPNIAGLFSEKEGEARRPDPWALRLERLERKNDKIGQIAEIKKFIKAMQPFVTANADFFPKFLNKKDETLVGPDWGILNHLRSHQDFHNAGPLLDYELPAVGIPPPPGIGGGPPPPPLPIINNN